MRRNYRFAGIEISVCIPDEKMYEDEYHLSSFSTDKVNNPQEYFFELLEQLDGPEGICVVNKNGYCVYRDGSRRIKYIGALKISLEGSYIRVCSEGKKHQVQLAKGKFPDKIGAKTVLNSIDVTRLLAEADGFILHCSYIEMNGRAILFTAPSETGKSTQAELWKCFRGAEIINGDRAAVRLIDGGIFAEGIPFAGSSRYCSNRTLPIAGIVYLGQASQTTIEQIRGCYAFSKIWQGISVNSWDKEEVEQISKVVQKVVENVPVYYLMCTPDESAVIVLEKILKEKNDQ